MKPVEMTIRCNHCGGEQKFHAQMNCDICNHRMSNWSIASQLKLKYGRVNNDGEDDCS